MPNHKLPILSCVASANTPLAKTNAQRQRGREGHGKDALWENEDLDWLNLAHPPRPLSPSPCWHAALHIHLPCLKEMSEMIN